MAAAAFDSCKLQSSRAVLQLTAGVWCGLC